MQTVYLWEANFLNMKFILNEYQSRLTKQHSNFREDFDSIALENECA